MVLPIKKKQTHEKVNYFIRAVCHTGQLIKGKSFLRLDLTAFTAANNQKLNKIYQIGLKKSAGAGC